MVRAVLRLRKEGTEMEPVGRVMKAGYYCLFASKEVNKQWGRRGLGESGGGGEIKVGNVSEKL